MKLIRRLVAFLLFLFIVVNTAISQETLPIYSDYLSDNVYLIHPAAAGIGNTGKLRLTARQQWSGVPNAPTLQTLSFHNRFSEKASLGVVMFNDKNGYHSQKGIQGTYAFHVEFLNDYNVNQLSFGLSLSAVQNQVDQTDFVGDPTVAQLVESNGYFNADFGVAYHRGGFSSYVTVKNLFLSARKNLNVRYEPLDLRNYILSVGYYFGKDLAVQLEPSLMVQLRESTGERIVDFNVKAYKDFPRAQLWAALSYRRSFDANPIQDLSFLTPIIGLNYRKFMFSYTYTRQINDVVLSTSGFHQLSVGFNLFQKRPRAAACPNLNASF